MGEVFLGLGLGGRRALLLAELLDGADSALAQLEHSFLGEGGGAYLLALDFDD